MSALFIEREIHRDLAFEFEEVKHLLDLHGLQVPEGIEYTVGLYDPDDRLVATGSLVGNILQGVAVEPELKGEGLSARVVTLLMKKALELGREKLFIFTKTSESRLFESLGFDLVESVEGYAAFLEWGRHGIGEFKEQLMDLSSGRPEGASCVVVNCNPFTLGHRYLIEKAASESPWLYVIVVKEDLSLFPFPVRYELVKKGVSDLGNVSVLPGGDYVISRLTFPSYFSRDDSLTSNHATLDLKIFGKHIAPSLKLAKRFVGEEPYCPVTSTYNEHMKKILPGYGVELVVVPRLEHGEKAISASTVREFIREDRLENAKDLLPASTYDFLVSEEAAEIRKNIRTSNSRH